MSATKPHATPDEVVTSRAVEQHDLLEIEGFIARVLGRAHTTAMSKDNPDEARAIFHLALSFAEEMEARTPGFNRFRFIDAATGV
jgi:hypothetical protein